MQKYILLISSVVLSALTTAAITVKPTAGGQLSSLVTNHNETTLNVTGVMDARDFVFITDKLTSLTVINLEEATIAAYESATPLLGDQRIFAANAIPPMALAGHPTLERFTVPSSVTTIGQAALAGCSKLINVAMNDGLTAIDSYAFAGCPAYATATLPRSLQRLGDGAFLRCTGLKTVKLGTSGTDAPLAIGNEAFMACSALNAITFSNKLASIGHRAFAGTAIKALDLSGYTSMTSVGDYAFATTPLTTVKFPSSVTTLGTGALLYSTATSVNISNGLERIPNFAFAGAKGIATINMNASKVDSIGDYAFYMLNQPSEFIVPATVSYIGTRAMAGMTGLSTITTRAIEVPALGNEVWYGLDQPAITLMAPSASIEQYKTTEQWKEFYIKEDIRKGDVNLDGRIDVVDINAVINYILKLDPGSPFVYEAADVNNDNRIDVEDINRIINIILKIEVYAPVAPNTDDVITIDDFTIEAGQTQVINVNLTNMTSYSAMQCDIVLPEGLSVIEDGVATTLSSEQFIVKWDEQLNTLRIICYNDKGLTLGGENNQAVIAITVKADDELPAQSIIVIENATLSTTDCIAYYCENTITQVSKNTAVTDIAAAQYKVWAQGGTLVIESEQATTAQLIAMNGTYVPLAVMGGHNEYSDIHPGFYVVRIGGTSHKVVIK